jgi:hypothetical protein
MTLEVVVVDKNENYTCTLDPDYKDKDGAEIPYKITNNKYGVVEARIDNLSQAYIFMYQMNALLVANKWKELIGLDPNEGQVPASVFSLVPTDTKKH